MTDEELQDLQAVADNAIVALSGLKEKINDAVLVIGGQRQDNERMQKDLSAVGAKRDELFVRVQELERELNKVEVERTVLAEDVDRLQHRIDATSGRLPEGDDEDDDVSEDDVDDEELEEEEDALP